jgi:hypothetical protein
VCIPAARYVTGQRLFADRGYLAGKYTSLRERCGKQVYLLQMDDFEPTPFLLQVFQNQASVAA